MMADQTLRGVVHGALVEPAHHAPCAQAIEREIGASIDDTIEIMSLPCRHPRIEIIAYALRCQHRDRMRAQMRIQPVADGVGLDDFPQIEMRDLPERMHAGVGAAGALDRHIFAGELPDRDFDFALHGRRIGLALPAGKRRTVILDQDFVARHGYDNSEKA